MPRTGLKPCIHHPIARGFLARGQCAVAARLGDSRRQRSRAQPPTIQGSAGTQAPERGMRLFRGAPDLYRFTRAKDALDAPGTRKINKRGASLQPGQGLDQGEGEGGPGGGSRRRPAGPGGGDGEAPKSHFYAPLACHYIITPPMHECQHTSRARPDSQLREGSTTRKGRVLHNAQLKPAKAVHMPQGDHFISGWTVSWQQHDKKWSCASRYIYWQVCRERGVRVKRHHANGAST